MSEVRTPDTYTCDICGTGGFTHYEVERVVVQALTHDNPYAAAKLRSEAIWHGDLCRECFGTRRVPNPSPEFDRAVCVEYGDGREGGLLHRFAKWLFAPLEMEATDD